MIEKWLELNYQNSSKYPLPDNKINITLSWNILNYQWIIWNSISSILSMSKIPTDPKDNSNFIYTTNLTQDSYKILAFWESNNLAFNNAYAWDNSNSFFITKWDLPILINNDNSLISTNTDLFINWSWTLYKQIIDDKTSLIWSWIDLWWWFQNLSKSETNYNAPKNCPDWYIPVKWSPNFSQPGFCIAKYEMSFNWYNYPDSYTWWIEWNSVSYRLHSWSVITSKSWNYPIWEINQTQAIKECNNIWWHLTTNNEWMTIARQIENNSKNWSSWVVWSWYVYNWVSNYSFWCVWITSQIYSWLPYSWGTKTWESDTSTQRAIDCNKTRQLYLENQEIIRDFAWNLWEHVNKRNTLNWAFNDYWNYSISWSSNPVDWDDNWYFDKSWLNANFSILWNYTDKWIWNLYYWQWKSNNIFLRWWWAYTSPNVWIYSLELDRTNIYILWKTWFRCAY